MDKRTLHNFEQQGKHEKLEHVLLEGINSGLATEMTREDWISIMARAKGRYEAIERKKRLPRQA
jgi:hypothetical protein